MFQFLKIQSRLVVVGGDIDGRGPSSSDLRPALVINPSYEFTPTAGKTLVSKRFASRHSAMPGGVKEKIDAF